MIEGGSLEMRYGLRTPRTGRHIMLVPAGYPNPLPSDDDKSLAWTWIERWLLPETESNRRDYLIDMDPHCRSAKVVFPTSSHRRMHMPYTGLRLFALATIPYSSGIYLLENPVTPADKSSSIDPGLHARLPSIPPGGRRGEMGVMVPIDQDVSTNILQYIRLERLDVFVCVVLCLSRVLSCHLSLRERLSPLRTLELGLNLMTPLRRRKLNRGIPNESTPDLAVTTRRLYARRAVKGRRGRNPVDTGIGGPLSRRERMGATDNLTVWVLWEPRRTVMARLTESGSAAIAGAESAEALLQRNTLGSKCPQARTDRERNSHTVADVLKLVIRSLMA
ncbi:hypothetical protein ACRALDRAFT_213201 [Sodiomyces alcalophilus JCM 7366]|uniref:uncharacterized protein n=1 Tax=Sodiomyces alcalophilus JCM 7366 TaxID=591952 RepID=UPI0039B3C266